MTHHGFAVTKYCIAFADLPGIQPAIYILLEVSKPLNLDVTEDAEGTNETCFSLPPFFPFIAIQQNCLLCNFYTHVYSIYLYL